jgi:hypothetical protein
MKANHFSSQFSRILLATFILLPVFSLFFVACNKEHAIIEDPITPPPDTIVVNPADTPDPANDLVAWYSPLTDVLLVDPNYFENVLVTLQAQPQSNGSFAMHGVNLLGEPRPVQFTVRFVEVPNIFLEVQATEKPLTPDLVSTFTEKGTSYKVFKNAECGKLSKGFESGCENGADGTSTKRIWYDIRRCERGNGFCTEALSVQGRSVTYHNANCQGPVKSESSINGYACW